MVDNQNCTNFMGCGEEEAGNGTGTEMGCSNHPPHSSLLLHTKEKGHCSLLFPQAEFGCSVLPVVVATWHGRNGRFLVLQKKLVNGLVRKIFFLYLSGWYRREGLVIKSHFEKVA